MNVAAFSLSLVDFRRKPLADPIEGVDYGRCIARIMRREDGTPWIHSIAHGRTTYEFRHNVASIEAAMIAAADIAAEAARLFPQVFRRVEDAFNRAADIAEKFSR